MQSYQNLGIASVPAVNQYLQQAETDGLSRCAALSFAGINADVLHDNSNYVSGEQFLKLLRWMVLNSPNPLFGLHSSRFVQAGSYSVLGFLSMNCGTLGEAVEKIQPFERLVGDMGVTEILQQGEQTEVRWHCRYPDPEVRQQMVDNVLSSWLSFARIITGQQLLPVQVSLTRPEPEPAVVSQYEAAFGCAVEFNQASDGIFMSNESASTPVIAANQSIRDTLEQHARLAVTRLSQSNSFAEQVRQLLAQRLPDGRIQQQDIADVLSVTVKTLQRRLKAENITFQACLDQVRFSLAKVYLEQPDIPVYQVAENLGFADVRSFSRRFQKWANSTPGEFRQQTLAAK